MPPRKINNLEQTYVYKYIVPEEEGVHTTRLMPDARAGDTYQITIDIEGTPEEIFDAMTDFEMMPESSHVIKSVKVTQRDELGAHMELSMHPEAHPGTWYYRYCFDRPNYRMHYWLLEFEGPKDVQVWDSIDVVVHIYPFGKISRVVLTENFTICEGQQAIDCVEIFTNVGWDILNRVKKRREKLKK